MEMIEMWIDGKPSSVVTPDEVSPKMWKRYLSWCGKPARGEINIHRGREYTVQYHYLAPIDQDLADLLG